MTKRILLGGLCFTLALSLVGCGGQQGQEPPQVEDVQQTEPVTTEPTAEPMEVKQEVEPTVTPAAPEEGEQDTGNEANPAVTDGEDEPAVELFTDVNETVYATGTVNLRSGPGTTYDKVGSLNKGDSVTRTGIGINDADGWSRIQLSNGDIGYVAVSYLSTAKPVVQQQQPSQSNPTGGQQQTQTPTDGSQQSSGGSQVSDEVIQAQIEAALKQQQEGLANGDTMGSGNITNEIIEDIGTRLNGG